MTESWFRTTMICPNGGDTWILQSTGPTPWFDDVSFSDSVNGTAVGSSGAIYHTTNGGVTYFEEDSNSLQPQAFLLSQNYPNPFNPVTKIKYSIPQNVRQETGNVSLKIYDVLGREVVTLVNEEKPAGEYEVEFDSRALTSGIYFYQLNAGKYSDTKKMILLK